MQFAASFFIVKPQVVFLESFKEVLEAECQFLLLDIDVPDLGYSVELKGGPPKLFFGRYMMNRRYSWTLNIQNFTAEAEVSFPSNMRDFRSLGMVDLCRRGRSGGTGCFSCSI
jgi:hypothetical protein